MSSRVDDVVLKASKLLEETSDSARLDAEILLEHVTGLSRLQMITHPDKIIEEEQIENYNKLLERRLKFEPVAYIIGEKEFYGRAFKVTSDVLIPRPETETLVELALEIISNQNVDEVLDLGTGSGAIALTLLAEKSELKAVLTDNSSAALDIAKENAEVLGVTERASFLHGSWFEPVLSSKKFQLILSNPPYVAEEDEVYEGARFEPQSALYANESGLSDVFRIIKDAPNFLNKGGSLIIEIGETQGEALKNYVYQMRDVYSLTEINKDLSMKDRFIRLTV